MIPGKPSSPFVLIEKQSWCSFLELVVEDEEEEEEREVPQTAAALWKKHTTD